MVKLRQISVALALALALCVTMLGTGAFAQSTTPNSANVTTTAVQRAYQSSSSGELGAQYPTRWVVKCAWHGWGWRRQWKCYRYWRAF